MRTTMISRRAALSVPAVLLALALAVALVPDSAAEGTEELDTPQGFSAEVLAGHASFPDDVAARFKVKHHRGGTIVSNLHRDASTVVVAKVTWEPGGSSGWHTHPGPVVVNVAEGVLEVVHARDCSVSRYTAGEAFVDPGQGNVHIATNVSEDGDTVAYATFLGVPAGAPATVWVPPADC